MKGCMLVGLSLLFLGGEVFACNDADLLSLINRPTIADSPCTVPLNETIIETGFQHRNLDTGSYANVYPAVQVREGLPKNTEIYTYLPDYFQSPAEPFSGFGTVALGLKHTVTDDRQFATAIDTMFIFPAGSAYYGRQSAGARISGVASYSGIERWTLLGMASFIYDGQPRAFEDKQYMTFSPDLIIFYKVMENVSYFLEGVSTTKVSPDLGSAVNIATGFIFLVTKNMTLDIEYGHRLSGYLNNFKQYVGAGGTIRF